MEKYNPFAYFYYHLYLLQLEEYDISRFLKTIWATSGIPKAKLRKKLIWTPKMILIAALSLLLIAVLMYTFSLVFFVTLYVFFVPITIIVILLTPLDQVLKAIQINKAKKILSQYPNLRIIGIAGSYGKTTIKEAVSTILEQKFIVVKTPENINTPLGIAGTIIKNVNEKTEVLVVEMGEYKRGDIRDICGLVKPHIGIITGINEAHLERMGSLDNAVAAIFEIATYMDPNGTLLINNDDKLVEQGLHKFTIKQQVVSYSSSKPSHLKSGLLGRYAHGVLRAADEVACKLGLTEKQIEIGALNIKPLPHRLEPIKGTKGVLVIDDSYNGNPEGVREAIHLLSTYKGRRKVFITPGLVETGERAEAIHREIGKELAGVADIVMLIVNSVTPFIARGLLKSGFDEKNIRWYMSVERAHEDLSVVIRPDDVVLFQNDWPDNYV